jgi:hypothetical protein
VPDVDHEPRMLVDGRLVGGGAGTLAGYVLSESLERSVAWPAS